ncbi:MAG: MaoC family dehydratase N-terminal domain-containing protein [Oscillibacter sp.]|nr:MaoC family dehydratase N-terminal domain-containing protein [Oscillibacter sp.]
MYLDDLNTSITFDLPEVSITKEQMVAFAKDYDPFRLHYDEAYAKTTRYGQLVAPGVMSFMSVWAKFMELDFFGEELIAGKSTKIEWFKPVFAGDTLRGSGRISSITPRNAYNGIAELTIEIRNQHGELVLTDVTESVVKRKA